MKTTLLTDLTVRDICEGFVYSSLDGKGLFGWAGKLVIQPEYQRHFIYSDLHKEEPVIDSVLNNYPLGLLYFVKVAEDKYEVLDGQQRITSLGRFVTGKFAIKDEHGMEQVFSGLDRAKQEKILNYPLTIYICEGEEHEIKKWFETINIAGVPLNEQELLNAIYSGPFVTRAKEVYSNSTNPQMQKWTSYIKGDPKRQEILRTALSWVARGMEHIDGYMSQHRQDASIQELQSYFDTVIDWAKGVFGSPYAEMRGLAWGELYERYHTTPYNTQHTRERVEALLADEYVGNKRGIFEYILGGEEDKSLLNVRVFDDRTKRARYALQTEAAQAAGTSNCPYCAMGDNANRTRIWKLAEMDADHVTAWSKGGATDIGNCEMLCKTHNRAKGNK
ncbi:MAG: DUF262 domain-containing protein [Bacteroidaceae bacterium]|nr:DUF262 domain-containing protein [Bacteroidaceae bacterium]